MNHEVKVLRRDGTQITATTVRLPSSLWNCARKLAIDLGISANQILNEGTEDRIAELTGKLTPRPHRRKETEGAA